MSVEPQPTFPKSTLHHHEDLNIMAQHKLTCTPGITNPYVPADMQVLSHDMCLETSDDPGQIVELFTRLMPCIVAERLNELQAHSPPAIDYRAYTVNFADDEIQKVMFGEVDMGAPAFMQTATRQNVNALRIIVEQWTSQMLRQYPEKKKGVFRRSLVICFQASFLDNFPVRDEHAITLALETRTPDLLRLLIFDTQIGTYHYAVHEQLQEWMAAVVQREAPTFRFMTHEVVGLRNHIHQSDFMVCMSVAYRVCLFLALIDDVTRIDETQDDFDNTTNYLQDHVIHALNWLHTQKMITGLRMTVLASRKMTQPFYELSNRDGGLFLYLMPYDFFKSQVSSQTLDALASAGPLTKHKGAITNKDRIFDALEAAHGIQQLRFDPQRGFIVVGHRRRG